MLLAADWNNDGNPDILYSSLQLVDPTMPSLGLRQTVTYYVNNGLGNFTVVMGAIAVPSTYTSMTIVLSCDLDDDGFNDIIGTAGYSTQASMIVGLVYLNMNGTSFSPAFEISMATNSRLSYVLILFTFEGHSHYCSLDACAQVMC